MSQCFDNDKVPLCQCGCGQHPKKARNGAYNKYLRGHNPKQGKSQKPSNNGNAGHFKVGNKHGKGRPEGSRNKATIAVENLFTNEAEALSRQCIELALSGNMPALKLCVDRICPVKKSVPVSLPELPTVSSVSDASVLTGYILKSVADGKLSPVDGEIISRSAERHLRALQIGDLEERLTQLENQLLSEAG